ncbi:MAG: flagellar basal-body rod protein FlgG [Deltaproteobacteria bacterium]|nr:flagellar basal-body rod protein FlgG [Deltaproteobacteria bacterium]
MFSSLLTASTGLQAQQLSIDVIANNLANVNTVGFKRSRADFEDLLYHTYRAPGTKSARGVEIPTGLQVGRGTRPVATSREFSTGELRNTGNPLDLAIEGKGFFQVRLPSGELAYTRAGAFKTDALGQLTTPDGNPVEPAISIPPDAVNVTIGKDGSVTAAIAGQPDAVDLGQIQLAYFVNPAGLLSKGRNLYTETNASGPPSISSPGENGVGTLAQGFLESSNVKIMEEMVDMIVSQRAYEINAKVVQTVDQMLHYLSSLR